MPDPTNAAVDVLIVGSGPIGSSIALALSGCHLKVAIISPPSDESSDSRPIALSHGSRLILEQLGAWPADITTPIAQIHVSHQGRFGRTRIDAKDHGLAALGYVVAYDKLNRAAATKVTTTRLDGLVTAIEDHGDFARAKTSQGDMDAKLIVIADGGHLTDARTVHYGQVALVAQISADTPHIGRAWERFTPDGPLALLPFGDGYAMVWCTSPQTAGELARDNEQSFLKRLQQAFGHRAGLFIAATRRHQFPLSLRRAKQSLPRSLAVGNAAQTLHPVAGQGLNLGLRDGVELARMIRDCAPQDLGCSQFASRYQATRSPDRDSSVRTTDTLVKLFSNSNSVIGLTRGCGLFLIDLLPAPRRFLARRMMFGMRALP